MPAGNRPLDFISSSPRDGAVGVSLNPRIRTTFSRNVVADEVWANNRTKLQLFRGATKVDIDVIRSPIFAQRHDIYVRPDSRLRPDTEYRLVILPGLKANNGQTLGATISIRFRTQRRGAIPQE